MPDSRGCRYTCSLAFGCAISARLVGGMTDCSVSPRSGYSARGPTGLESTEGVFVEKQAVGLVVRRRAALGVLVGAVMLAPLAVAPHSAAAKCVVNAAGDVASAHTSPTSCCPDGSKAVGQVSKSNGRRGAPKNGTYVCAGDKVGGIFASFTVTTTNGAVWGFVPGDTGTFLQGGALLLQSGKHGKGGDTFNGTYTAPKAARDAAGDPVVPDLEATTPNGTTGVYVPPAGQTVSFTLTLWQGRPPLLHMISGRGFVTPADGGQTLQVPAGQGAWLLKDRASLTSVWPRSAQRAVPPSQRPPSLTGLRFHGGTSPRIRFHLGSAATVAVRVVHNGRTVRTRTKALLPGAGSVALGHLAAGRYVLEISAADPVGRTTLLRRKVRQS